MSPYDFSSVNGVPYLSRQCNAKVILEPEVYAGDLAARCRNTDRVHRWMGLLALPEGGRANGSLSVYAEGTEGNSQDQGVSMITIQRLAEQKP
jgi:hypothetical protein